MDDKYYFTGKPCKNGHIANRLRSNRACTECERIRDRSKQNTGKISSKWWSENDVKILKSGKSMQEIAKVTSRSEAAIYQKVYRIGKKWGSGRIWKPNKIWGSNGHFKEKNSKIKLMKTAFDLINSTWKIKE